MLVEQGTPAAHERFAQAITQVEQVGDAIADEQERAGFYDTRAPLYADAVADTAQAQDAERMRALVGEYRGRAGRVDAWRWRNASRSSSISSPNVAPT